MKGLISRGSVVLIDVRNTASYKEEHISGAVNIPEIFTYLGKSTPEGLEEMHQKFKGIFSKAGLSNDKTAIFYEDSLNTLYGGSCRGYWLLSHLGHVEVGVLDGGLVGWTQKGLPLDSEDVILKPAEFSLNPQVNIMATKDDVLKAINDPLIILIDDRDKPEWMGESSSPYSVDFAPRKGRIPGAKWIEWHEFMNLSLDIPAFKPNDEIKALCAKRDIYPDNDIIIYCFKGSRAANTYVAMKKAGFKRLRVYFASWNEWSRYPELPIETGIPKD